MTDNVQSAVVAMAKATRNPVVRRLLRGLPEDRQSEILKRVQKDLGSRSRKIKVFGLRVLAEHPNEGTIFDLLKEIPTFIAESVIPQEMRKGADIHEAIRRAHSEGIVARQTAADLEKAPTRDTSIRGKDFRRHVYRLSPEQRKLIQRAVVIWANINGKSPLRGPAAATMDWVRLQPIPPTANQTCTRH